MTRWTAADVAKYQTSGIAQALVAPQRNRHGNHKVQWQGEKFDSKHELQDYQDLLLEKLAGRIRSVIRQVSIPIHGSRRRIRLDFVIVGNDGSIRWVDSKGHAEREWLLKRDIVQTQYGITIETV